MCCDREIHCPFSRPADICHPPPSRGLRHAGKKRTYTVGQVFEAIYGEISFYGPPVERNRLSRELDKQCDDIDAGLAETISFEDVLRDRSLS